MIGMLLVYGRPMSIVLCHVYCRLRDGLQQIQNGTARITLGASKVDEGHQYLYRANLQKTIRSPQLNEGTTKDEGRSTTDNPSAQK